jgi:branched-chain amino acid transport system permease protein
VAEILRQRGWILAAAAIAVAALAAVPAFTSGYIISLFLFLFANVAMSTAWAFFSGPTRYISLATAAFIGVGIYTVIFLIDRVPLALALAAAPVVGFLVALVVGLSTLRLRGVYFVIFTFGLTELIKQLVIWYEVHQNKTLLRFVFADVTPPFLYELLLAIAAFTILACWLGGYTRLGFALRAIGEDETVARHTGINTTRVKVIVFALSASVISLTGAVLSLRYTYLDPNVAFNSVWSFQVLIMALLGGVGRAWGPALGAIPLVLLSDYLAGSLPHHFGIALGLCFVLIVYFVPGGIAPRVEHLWQLLRPSRAKSGEA